MSRLPDLVLDSRLRTQFYDSVIIHSYLEIDNVGGRFSREERWKPERFLGSGGFGQVRLERCIENGTSENSLRAVKIIKKPLNPSESLDMNRELEAISKFSNDRYKRWFVKSFGWFDDLSYIFITMEYCNHGDLHRYLMSQRTVAVEDVQQLTYQMLEALDQMHQNDFAHRDLKPGNILIKSMPPDDKWWIVLADFGISKRTDESKQTTTAIKGTPTFMTPELHGYLGPIKPKSIADFKAADMWALGEIVVQMLTGETTFENTIELVKYCLGQRKFPLNRLPVSVGDDCHEFVTSVMMALPQDRITTTQCIHHRWLELLRVEEELAALDLEQGSPLVPEIPWNESASLQWSRLSNPEHTPKQTTAQRRPTSPTYLDSSGTRQTQLESISSSPPIQQYLNTDQEPLTFAITPTVAEPLAEEAPIEAPPLQDEPLEVETGPETSTQEKIRLRHSHSQSDSRHSSRRRRESEASTKERPTFPSMALFAAAKLAAAPKNKRRDDMAERDDTRGKEHSRAVEKTSSSRSTKWLLALYPSNRYRKSQGNDKQSKRRMLEEMEQDLERRRRHEARKAEKERAMTGEDESQRQERREKRRAARLAEEEEQERLRVAEEKRIGHEARKADKEPVMTEEELESARQERRDRRRAAKLAEVERMRMEEEQEQSRVEEERRIRREKRRQRYEAEKKARWLEIERAEQAEREK